MPTTTLRPLTPEERALRVLLARLPKPKPTERQLMLLRMSLLEAKPDNTSRYSGTSQAVSTITNERKNEEQRLKKLAKQRTLWDAEIISDRRKSDPAAKNMSDADILRDTDRIAAEINTRYDMLLHPEKYGLPTTFIGPAPQLTEEEHKQRQEAFLRELEKSRDLAQTLQAFEIINHPDNPIGWIPGVRTMYNMGADQHYRSLTGERHSPYETAALLSAGGDALMGAFGGFSGAGMKALGGAYLGNIVGGIVGELYGHPDIGRFTGSMIGGFSPEIASGIKNVIPEVSYTPLGTLSFMGLGELKGLSFKPNPNLQKFIRRSNPKNQPDYETYLRYKNGEALDLYGAPISGETLEKYQNGIVKRLEYENNNNLNNVLSKHNISAQDGTYMRNNKALSSEEAEILTSAPVYYDWAISNGLNPVDRASALQFIQKLGTNVRGVHAENAKDAAKFITTPSPNLGKISGDRFKSKRGIYNSNSTTIGTHYAETPIDDRSFMGITFHDYKIDPNLPVLLLLELLSMKDVLWDKFPNVKYEGTKLIPRGYRFNNAGVESFSNSYRNYSGMSFPASEKVYFKPLSLTELLDLGLIPQGPRGRWYANGVLPDDLFFTRFYANTPAVRDYYTSLGLKVLDHTPTLESKAVFGIARLRAEAVKQMYSKLQRKNRNIRLGVGLGLTIPPTAYGAYLLFGPSDSTNSIDNSELQEGPDLSVYDNLDELN